MSDDLKRIPISPRDEVPDEEASYSSNDSGVKEAELLGSGLTQKQIQDRAEKNEADRNEKFRDHFEIIALISLWAFFLLFAALILAWFWHYMTPACWHWLSPDQLTKVQTLATGGIVATIAAGHLKKRMG